MSESASIEPQASKTKTPWKNKSKLVYTRQFISLIRFINKNRYNGERNVTTIRQSIDDYNDGNSEQT